MKKFKYVFLMILTVLFLGSFNVEAKVGQTAPSSITLSSSDLTATGVGTNEAVFITKDGNYAYCISPGKEYPKAGTTLKLMGDYNDNAAYYIMSQSLSGNSQYVTNQLAIWYAQTATLPARYSNHMNTDLVKKAKALASTAKSKGLPTKNVTMEVNMGSTTLNEQSDGSYLSDAITVKLVNASTYKVTLTGAPAGAYLVNSSNVKASEFKSGEAFKVYVPKSNNLTETRIDVNISATGVIPGLKRYKYNDSYQELAVLYSTEKTVTAKRTLVVKPVKRSCEKIGDDYYDKNGNKVDYNEYKNQCLNICKKVGDDYYDKNGNKVDYNEYKNQCLNICKKVDDKYYGIEGNLVTFEQYKKECLHICEVVDGVFYGKDGLVVNEQEYNNQCNPTEVIVPDTLNKTGLGLILGTILLVIGSTFVVINKKRMND